MAISLFTDNTGRKIRPAIVISNQKSNEILQDCLVIPLSTIIRNYHQGFLLNLDSIESGNLIMESQVRVDKIHSINQKLIISRVGKVKPHVIARIKKILTIVKDINISTFCH